MNARYGGIVRWRVKWAERSQKAVVVSDQRAAYTSSHIGRLVDDRMRIIARGTLRSFWESSPAYADAMTPLVEWYRHMEKATYRTPQEVKAELRTASILKGGRVAESPAAPGQQGEEPFGQRALERMVQQQRRPAGGRQGLHFSGQGPLPERPAAQKRFQSSSTFFLICGASIQFFLLAVIQLHPANGWRD